MSTPERGRRLWSDDVAAALGIKRSSVIYGASRTKRRKAQGIAPSLVDVPIPAGRRKRKITTEDGQPRTVLSPWWWEADILATRAARERVGQPGPRQADGRFVTEQSPPPAQARPA